MFLKAMRSAWPSATGLLLVLALATGCDDSEDAEDQAAVAPAPSVTIAGVATRDIKSVYSFVGQVVAVDSINIVPRVEGFLKQPSIEDGSWANKGDLLFEIEPEEFEADLTAAKAAAAEQQAQLALAEIDLDRNSRLLQSDTIAQAQYDASLAERNATQAQLEAANAKIRLAQLNLDYTQIHAPFSGRIGEILVSEGDTVGPGVTLSRLVSLSPIEVAFSISESAYLDILEHVGTEVIGTQRDSNATPIKLVLPNEQVYDETGRITFVNNAVDPRTGTIAMRARFENARNLLAPGIYVTVEVEEEAAVEQLVVPQAAVQRDQRGSFVLVVGREGTVEQRYVELGETDETDFIVTSGLQEGESVITEGLQRVRPGVPVNAVRASTGAEN